MQPLMLSNLEIGDVAFESDVGSWNVTRAVADCLAGKHKVYRFSVAEVLAANAAVEVDEAKVTSMVADPARLAAAPPGIFGIENNALWLIDGHHRLRALARLGAPEFLAFVIEDQDAARYRVWYNGMRVAPWRK